MEDMGAILDLKGTKKANLDQQDTKGQILPNKTQRSILSSFTGGRAQYKSTVYPITSLTIVTIKQQ